MHDAELDSFYDALKYVIGFDQSSVQNLVVDYVDDGEAGWTCDITHNGKVYEARITAEWYTCVEGNTITGVGADFWIRVPQGYRLTTTVQLDANTIIKHK